MAKGLVGKRVALSGNDDMDAEDAKKPAPGTPEALDRRRTEAPKPPPHQGGAARAPRGSEPPPAPEEPEGELDDAQFDDAIARVSQAALIALKTPDMRQALEAAAQSQDPADALANLAYDVIEALSEKSGHSIPLEVMPAAAFEVLGMVFELAQASANVQPDQNAVQTAARAMMRRFVEEIGGNPMQAEQLMQQATAQLQGGQQQQQPMGAGNA